MDPLVVTRNAYTPYGAVRGADNLTIDHGWLNKIADTVTGLTYLGARYYDPLASRFISPDPLLNPMDPKTLDAYMYSNDNPVMFSDASGLTPYYQGNTKILDEYYADGSQYKTPTSTTPKPNLPPKSSSAGSNGGDDSLPVTEWFVAGGLDAGKTLRKGLSSDASYQGSLMGAGLKNSLWRYSPRSGGIGAATYRVTSSGVMRYVLSGAAATGVGAILTYKANSGLYMQVDNQAQRQTLIVGQTTMQVSVGALVADVVGTAGFALCPESWGIGCGVAAAAAAAGAAWFASDQTGKGVEKYVDSQLPVYLPGDPWWVGKPGYDPGVLGPPSGYVGQIPGLNAPGTADAYALTGSTAIPQFSESNPLLGIEPGKFVGMVCGPAN